MCQAEEIGIATGFCGTLGGVEIANRLGKPDKLAVISIGFGYATPDIRPRRPVVKDGATVGFDLSNTDPSIRTLENRKNRPPMSSMINYL
jgi:hypothetical protein